MLFISTVLIICFCRKEKQTIFVPFSFKVCLWWIIICWFVHGVKFIFFIRCGGGGGCGSCNFVFFRFFFIFDRNSIRIVYIVDLIWFDRMCVASSKCCNYFQILNKSTNFTSAWALESGMVELFSASLHRINFIEEEKMSFWIEPELLTTQQFYQMHTMRCAEQLVRSMQCAFQTRFSKNEWKKTGCLVEYVIKICTEQQMMPYDYFIYRKCSKINRPKMPIRKCGSTEIFNLITFQRWIKWIEN